MFPTTIWDVVHAAGARDPAALNRLAHEYRAPVLAFIQRRGIAADLAEDLCQDVFVRVLTRGVLTKASADRGTFRSLLCTVTVRVVQDWRRRQKEWPSDELEPAVPRQISIVRGPCTCGWRIRKNPGQRSIFTSRDLESSRTPHRSQASDGRLTHCPTLS